MEEQREREYSELDDAAIEKLIEDGELRKALEAIKVQVDRDVANGADFVNEARIHLAFLDGIAAEASLERASEAGVPKDEVALLLARALMLQNDAIRAKEVIWKAELLGDMAFEATILKGDIEKELGDQQGATYFYRLAIDKRPDDFRGYLGLSMLALGQGKLSDAEEWAAQAASKVEDDSIVRYVRGTVARYQRRFEEAEAHLRQSVQLHSANLLAYFELAALLIETGELEKANLVLDEVYKRAPDSPMAQYYSALALAVGGNLREAEHLLLRVGDLTRRYPPAARAYGHVLFQLDKFSTARPYLERVLARIPSDRLTRLALAECLTRRGDAARALGVLNPLLEEGAVDLDARFQEAAAYGALGNLPEVRRALADARAIAETMGDEGDERVNALSQRLALTRFLDGDRDGAIDELKGYYSEGPKDKDGLMLLANMQLEAGDVEGAEISAGEIAALDPEGAESANLLGAVRLRQGRYEEALLFLDAAIKRNPEYQSALKNRGLAYMGLSRFEEASADLEILVSNGGQDGQVLGMLGRVYLELERPAEASKYLKVAADIIPQSAIIATDLAEALAQSGYRSSAVSQARLARRLASRDPALEAYIDGLIAKWNQEEAEEAALEAQRRQEEREKLAKQREDMEKARQAIIDEAAAQGQEEGAKADTEDSDEEEPPKDGADDSDEEDKPKEEGA
ncbi:MAG: tetratricopeptide repeat protein [Alphaproteobacteria bacterium]|nr:tetratricopeptide repeat protein [Alphaproteobacteria bacterium]